MKLTNKLNLPQSVVEAIRNDPYDAGDSDSTVTKLIRAPYQVQLEKKHWDDIEEDVSNRLWALFGQIGHTLLERADTNAIKEKRLSTTINDWKISGQLDELVYLPEGVLSDYKFTSVYTVLNGHKKEWESQLNLLSYLLVCNGYERPQKTQIVALLRDWSAAKATYDSNLPRAPIKVIDIPHWDQETQLTFLKERIKLHQDLNPESCTNEERWYSGDSYAVMKKGRKRALRVLSTEHDALLWATQNMSDKDDGKMTIEFRPGKYRRCEDYCSVSKFCPIWQEYLENKEAA